MEDNDKSHIRAEGIIELDKFDLSFIPVKIQGFKRSYSIKIRRLNCIYTGNKEDFVNGVIINGLDKKQLNKISSTEKGYSLREIGKEDISFYSQEPSGDFDVNIYVADQDNLEEGFSDRNKIYHKRVLAGIQFLKLKYNNEIAQEFYEDFITSV